MLYNCQSSPLSSCGGALTAWCECLCPAAALSGLTSEFYPLVWVFPDCLWTFFSCLFCLSCLNMAGKKRCGSRRTSEGCVAVWYFIRVTLNYSSFSELSLIEQASFKIINTAMGVCGAGNFVNHKTSKHSGTATVACHHHRWSNALSFCFLEHVRKQHFSSNMSRNIQHPVGRTVWMTLWGTRQKQLQSLAAG